MSLLRRLLGTVVREEPIRGYARAWIRAWMAAGRRPRGAESATHRRLRLARKHRRRLVRASRQRNRRSR